MDCLEKSATSLTMCWAVCFWKIFFTISLAATNLSLADKTLVLGVEYFLVLTRVPFSLKLGNLDWWTMFQPTPKRCFTIESLVAKDNPLPASRSEEPIRPAALSYANSSQMNPFLNGFHSSGRGVYSNPDLVFAEAVSHPPNSAVPVHSVPPPHALAAHPLSSSHSPHPLFASQQRDPSTFYPWLIHRYRYLGHRFQGKFMQNILFANYFDQSSREKKKGHTYGPRTRRFFIDN